MIYPRAIPHQNGKVAEAPLKAKKFYRNISISEDTIEVLEAQKKSNWRVCVPITQRRPHVPGQRGPYAPPDAEASGPAQAPPSMILTQLRQSAAQSGHPHEDIYSHLDFNSKLESAGTITAAFAEEEPTEEQDEESMDMSLSM